MVSWFHEDGSPISEHFRYSLHDFGRVVTRAHHGIAAEIRGMSQHEVEGISARFLTELRQQSDVASENGLQAGTDSSENRARAHNNPAHHAQRSHHTKSVELELGSHHVVRDQVSWSRVAHRHKKKLPSRKNSELVVAGRGGYDVPHVSPGFIVAAMQKLVDQASGTGGQPGNSVK